jgi:hypothetical protein
MDTTITILGRRLDVTEPAPPEPNDPGRGGGPGRHDRDGAGRQPPDDLGMLVGV